MIKIFHQLLRLNRKGILGGLLFTLGVALLPLYYYRASFVEKYDLGYVQDHYHHSQWAIPNSPWGIGDDGFYQYAGNEIANGVDPYLINPEAPPLGKYLYGFSIKWFSNPYFAIIPAYLVTVGAFYFLTFFFISKNKWRLFATVILVSSPILSAQLNSTTLDLFQLCWMILHLLAVFSLISARRHWLTICAVIAGGITLGLFIGTKFGLLGLFLVVADTYVLVKQRRLISLLAIFAISICVYISLYANHFFLGGNIATWVKGRKWILNYWLNNQPKGTPFLVFITVLSGWWINFERVKEWTIVWPLGATIFLANIYMIFKRKINDLPTKYIIIFVAGFFVVFLTNFFWARYVLIILPFLIIFLTKFLSQKKMIATIIATILILVTTINSYSFSLEATKREMSFAWENGFYKDLYNYLPQEFSEKYSRNEFDQISSEIDFKLGYPTKSVSFTSDNYVLVSYKTKVGEIMNKQPVRYLKENGRWKILWSWNFLLPRFSPGDTVEIAQETYQKGPVFADDGTNLSSWGEWPYVFVTPSKINEANREVFLKNLADATSDSKERLRILLYVTSRKNWQVPIGFLRKDIVPDPAITIKNVLTRVSPSSQCSKTMMSRQIETGGSIILINKTGHKEVLLQNHLGC